MDAFLWIVLLYVLLHIAVAILLAAMVLSLHKWWMKGHGGDDSEGEDNEVSPVDSRSHYNELQDS